MIFLLSIYSEKKYNNGHPLLERIGSVEAGDIRRAVEHLDMEITHIMFKSERGDHWGVSVDLTDNSGRKFFLESIMEIRSSSDVLLLL